MTNLNVKLFIPFEKKNSDEQIVEGYATTEALDSQGEVVKADAIQRALPDYMKFGNIREMHQWSAVGKAIAAVIDEKGTKLTAKVVDPTAWAKVKEGVYNGFSIGGRVVKRVGNVIQELILNEISLVDRPANPEAVFSLVKMQDGKITKDGVESDMMEEPSHLGISLASNITDMASNLAMYASMCKDMGRDCSHLEKAISALKEAAMKELEMDKVAKSQASKEETEKKEKIMKELLMAKKTLEEAIASKTLYQPGEQKYFDQHRQSV